MLFSFSIGKPKHKEANWPRVLLRQEVRGEKEVVSVREPLLSVGDQAGVPVFSRSLTPPCGKACRVARSLLIHTLFAGTFSD